MARSRLPAGACCRGRRASSARSGSKAAATAAAAARPCGGGAPAARGAARRLALLSRLPRPPAHAHTDARLAPRAVVSSNAEKVAVTGRKETDKMYFRHTNGRPGGGKFEALRDLRQVSRVPPPAPWSGAGGARRVALAGGAAACSCWPCQQGLGGQHWWVADDAVGPAQPGDVRGALAAVSRVPTLLRHRTAPAPRSASPSASWRSA